VAERILGEVNAFNMESRRRQAQLERRFVEERLAEARAALRVAEDRLLTWAATNRVIGSPRLLLEQQRLEREVAQAEGLYTSLEQGFAQARLSELRNMPAVVTVEEPEVPARPAPRFVVQKVAAATVAGLALALAIAFVRAFVFAPSPGRAAVAAVSARDER
jgi:uncharacterized protein involved in exopolysaccharide biosynthesis